MKVKDLPKPLRNWLWKWFVFRPAIVYAYSIIDLEQTTNAQLVRELWAYVGQTRQELISRHNQHMGIDNKYKTNRQPWSDLYPEIRIIWQGKCPNFVLDLIEMFYIKRRKPLFNYIHNTKNPRRITKFTAEYQRSQRDRLARMRRGW
jgi:phenylalanine-4-hydroxylase